MRTFKYTRYSYNYETKQLNISICTLDNSITSELTNANHCENRNQLCAYIEDWNRSARVMTKCHKDNMFKLNYHYSETISNFKHNSVQEKRRY